MTLSTGNPMTKVLVTLLAFEAVVFGLAVAVMVWVSAIPVLTAAVAGGAAFLLAVAAAGTLRRPFGFALGWATQLAALALGLLTPAMFALGGVFVALWIVTFVLGRRLDEAR